MSDIYNIDGHKLLWHLDRVHEWQVQRIIPPIYVEISPVSFCNHRCIFCGVDFAMQSGLKLETDLMCQRLREMGKLGVRSVMFAGEGEPLLHPDLPLLVLAAKESGIDVSITSNGTLGNEKTWEDVLPYLTWIKFSIDAGSAEVYSRVHSVPEAMFEKTMESVRAAVRVKRAKNLAVTIGVQFLMIDENMDDIRNALELFSSVGVDYFVLKPYSLHPQMRKEKDMEYTEDALVAVRNIISDYELNSPMHIIFRNVAAERYGKRGKKYDRCNALAFWGYISTQGDFYTCSVYIGDDRFRVGNIYHYDMKHILFGKKRRESIEFGENILDVERDCRVNCRMACSNEFLERLKNGPQHIDFI